MLKQPERGFIFVDGSGAPDCSSTLCALFSGLARGGTATMKTLLDRKFTGLQRAR